MKKLSLLLILSITVLISACRETEEKKSETTTQEMTKAEAETMGSVADGADGGGTADTNGSRNDSSGKADKGGTRDVHDSSKAGDKTSEPSSEPSTADQ